MALTKITSNIITDGTIATDDLATATITSISGSGNSSSSSLASRVTVTEASSSNINQDVKSSASPTFAGGTVTGDLSVGGILTAQEFHTEFESASIIYTSGSNKFGDSSDDVHHMSGSLRITGSGDHYIQTGNFGIGTASPGELVEIKGTTTARLALHADTNGDPSLIFEENNSQKWELNYDSSLDKIRFYNVSQSSDHLVLLDTGDSYFNTGNVGIGTTSPDTVLDVSPGATTPTSIGGQNINLGQIVNTTSGRSGITIRTANDYLDGAGFNHGFGFIYPYADGVNSDDRSYKAFKVAHGSTLAETFSVDKYGRVYASEIGIGVTNPTTKFEVYDASSGADFTTVEYDYNTKNRKLRFGIADGNPSIQGTLTNDSATSLAINPGGGNVGIGIATPSATLHIETSAAQDLLRITDSSYPADVFKVQNGGLVQIQAGGTSPDPDLKIIDVDADGRAALQVQGNSGATEILYCAGNGNVGIGYTSIPSGMKFAVNGKSYTNDGLHFSSTSDNNAINVGSHGSGSTTLYIGNATITVSSDERIKKNIKNTKINATETLNKLRVVDFEWDDPSDNGSYNNKNARVSHGGQWTGLVAQEIVNHVPHIVNAPRKEDTLEIDYESDDTWFVDFEHLVPTLVKAVQELSAQNDALTARIEALES